MGTDACLKVSSAAIRTWFPRSSSAPLRVPILGPVVASKVKVLISVSFFLFCSEYVTWATAQFLLAATQVRCNTTPGNGGILLAAKMAMYLPPYVEIV